MKTAKDREEEFLADLNSLLKRHGAELEITDDGASYGRQQAVARVSMKSIYDHEKDLAVAEFTEFELPLWMDGE